MLWSARQESQKAIISWSPQALAGPIYLDEELLMSMILCLKSAAASQIAGLLNEPATIEEFLDMGEPDYLELDKAWHGIHFLLTNSAWEGAEPLCYLVRGGQEIGDIDVGYGPARAITSQQAAAFELELSKIEEADFRQRFNPKQMMANDIYPSIWDRPIEEDDTLGYLCSYFTELKEFVNEVCKKGHGIIIWMT